MEDTKRIRFSNMAKFMFNEDQAIIFNRLNGQWIKVPKQCYDILELCNKEGLSWSALSESLADDEDREYMKQLIKLLDSMNCLYNDDEKIIENISFAITHRCNLKCICTSQQKVDTFFIFYTLKTEHSTPYIVLVSNSLMSMQVFLH